MVCEHSDHGHLAPLDPLRDGTLQQQECELQGNFFTQEKEDRKQRKGQWQCALTLLSLLFYLGSQPMGWCYPHPERIFSAKSSGNTLRDVPGGVPQSHRNDKSFTDQLDSKDQPPRKMKRSQRSISQQHEHMSTLSPLNSSKRYLLIKASPLLLQSTFQNP